MKILLNIKFWVLIVLGIIVYTLNKTGIKLPYFIENHLNDLLIIPIVLWISLATLVEIKGNKAKISWGMTLSIIAYYSVFFEWYLPKFNPRYTSDILDILCYISGGCLFMMTQKNIKKFR